MARYRKKPVVIEAFQYDGDVLSDNGFTKTPEWFKETRASGIVYFKATNKSPCEMIIKTLEGDHRASIGYYIIQGVNGELYPCKPDIFEKTYEPA